MPTATPLRSLADLKRCPLGTTFRLTQLGRPLVIRGNLGNTRIEPLKDALRVVHKVNSNSLQFTGDRIANGETSWLMFPKASEIVFDNEGFTISSREEGVPALRYAYVTE
jgi:hypothetical protein